MPKKTKVNDDASSLNTEEEEQVAKRRKQSDKEQAIVDGQYKKGKDGSSEDGSGSETDSDEGEGMTHVEENAGVVRVVIQLEPVDKQNAFVR